MSPVLRAVLVSSALFASALALPTVSCTKKHPQATVVHTTTSCTDGISSTAMPKLTCTKKHKKDHHHESPASGSLAAASSAVASGFSTGVSPLPTAELPIEQKSPAEANASFTSISVPAASSSIASSTERSPAATGSPSTASGTTPSSTTAPKSNTPGASSCFPYGNATLPSDDSAPSVSRDAWWCPASQQYGFQGFSYPLEDADCSAASNGLAAMSADFARMKRDFGASMVRVYYPACTAASVFENLLRAGVANNMAVIPQLWFGFDGDDSIWRASRDALYSVMDSPRYGAVAPYVFHSADFGSEPVGDQVDGGSARLVSDLKVFKAKMNGWGVPVGISEDWDRPGTMSGADGAGLAAVGQMVRDASDHVHAHVMPFYHGNIQEGDAWVYIAGQIEFLAATVRLPTLITETQWAWGESSHYGGHVDVGARQYAAYWRKYDDECELFRAKGIGWFLHDWAGEETFDIRRADGSYVIPDWRPRRC